jgi:hypothetical protein
MRRASIDRINARYRGTAVGVSPPVVSGFAARTSAIRSVSPVAPVYGATYTPASAVISTGPSIIAGGRTSLIGGRGAAIGTVGRGTVIAGGHTFGSTLAPVVAQNTVIRNSRIGVSGIRGSVVTSPPVYEAVQHPPVYEVITTPPKVYEIVTPVVEVTPDTVVQQ